MWRDSGEQVVEECSEGVDIPTCVRMGTQVGLLRGHVIKCSQGRVLFMGKAGLSKVAKARRKVVVNQHVSGFEIAMQDAAAVGMHKAVQDAYCNSHGFGRRKGPVNQVAGQRSVFEILHHVVGRITLPPDGEEPDDMARTVQRRQFLHFSGQECPVESAVMAVDFDRHQPAGVFLASEPHRAERAVTQTAFEGKTGQDQCGMPRLPAEGLRIGCSRFFLNRCVSDGGWCVGHPEGRLKGVGWGWASGQTRRSS